MNNRYTVDEIDAMRGLIREIMCPRVSHDGKFIGFWDRDQFESVVENRLRTYMTNGTQPEELEVKAINMRSIGKPV